MEEQREPERAVVASHREHTLPVRPAAERGEPAGLPGCGVLPGADRAPQRGLPQPQPPLAAQERVLRGDFSVTEQS